MKRWNSFIFIFVTVTIVILSVLINFFTNRELSAPGAVIIGMLTILLVIFTLASNNDPQSSNTHNNFRRMIVGGGATIILSLFFYNVTSQQDRLNKQEAEIDTKSKQLAKEREEYNQQRALQITQLRIGQFPDANRKNGPSENIIRGHLSEKLHDISVTVEIVGPQYVDTMKAIVEGTKDKGKDVGYFGPLLYLHTIQKHPEVKPILFMPPDDPKQEYYYSYIIVRNDSGISSLIGVRGKHFVFGDEWSTSGTLYPKYFLKQAGIEDVRGSYESAHSEIIKKVIESKEILVGAVSSFAYQKYVDGLKKDEENQLTILNKAISEQHPIIPGPIVLRPGIQDFDILSIKDAYLSINDPNVLLTIGTGKFTSLTAEEAKGAYKPVADIAEQMGLTL